MAVISYDCPHCHTLKVAFPLAYEYSTTSPADQTAHRRRYNSIGICQGCNGAVIFEFFVQGKNLQDPKAYPNDPRSFGWQLGRVWPQASPSSLPEHVPEHIQKIYVQGEKSLKAEAWDAAGAMFRKVVDISTIELKASPKKRLIDRIDELESKHALTPALKQVAHKVRLDGNGAVHDEEPFSKEDAVDIEFFTRMFLLYAFTLPGMLEPKLKEHGAASQAS